MTTDRNSLAGSVLANSFPSLDVDLVFCTVAAVNYLPRVRALAKSLAEHCPGRPLVLLLCDRPEAPRDMTAERFAVMRIDELDLPSFEQFVFRYDILELSCAVKPYLFTELLRRGARRVVYLDPDIEVFGGPDWLNQALDRASIVLTPHLLDPIPLDGRGPSEVAILQAGSHNLGFLGLRAGAGTDRLLQWWRERLEHGCRMDIPAGYHVDQKWMDLVPGYSDDTVVVRDPGCNVAYWNLHSRALSRREGRWHVDGSPLKFFHYSGFDPHRPEQVSCHQNRVTMDSIGPASELFRDYALRLRELDADGASSTPYGLARWDDGVPITPGQRRRFRETPEVWRDRPAAHGLQLRHELRVGDPEGRAGADLIGYLRSEKGVGEAARACLRALQSADVPYGVSEVVDVGSRNDVDFGCDGSALGGTRAVIVHINADMVAGWIAGEGRSVVGRPTVGCWNWELDTFPPEWIRSFDACDEIWVPSRFTLASVASVSPIPVRLVPLSVCVPPRDAQPVSRADFGLPADAFLFLYAFDVQSYLDRKNPEGVVRAFRAAFGDRSDVCLALKAHHADHDANRVAAMRELVGGAANIRILTETLSRAKMMGLMRLCDAYVSLHRSEGFGLTPAEAMAMGKPVIVTDYSATTDFVNARTGFPVRYKLVQIERDAGPYKRGGRWAEPDEAHAADLMRQVVSDRAGAAAIGRAGKRFVERELCPVRIGKLMGDLLDNLNKRCGRYFGRSPLPPSDVVRVPLPSHRRGLTGLVARTLKRLAAWTMRPQMERQTDWNSAISAELIRLRDIVADQQERLADQQERLADQQERLADQQERLDEAERRLASRAAASTNCGATGAPE